MKVALLFLGYKGIWLTGILGDSFFLHPLTPLLAGIYLFASIPSSVKKYYFFIYVASIAAIGICAETFILNQYAYAFEPPTLFVPPWLMSIWVAFPCMCLNSLKQTLQNSRLAVMIGVIGGPMAYKGAHSLGAITIHNGWLPMIILAVVWGGIMVITHTLQQWLKSKKPPN